MNAGEIWLNSTGLFAADEECYDTLSELKDPVINEVHEISDSVNGLKSVVNLRWDEIKGGNLYGTNVLSCRLSPSTNIHGYDLIPGCSSGELLDAGHAVVKSLNFVDGEKVSSSSSSFVCNGNISIYFFMQQQLQNQIKFNLDFYQFIDNPTLLR